MVKSRLINAFLYTVLTDGPGSLAGPLRGFWVQVTYRKCLDISGMRACRALLLHQVDTENACELAQASRSFISRGISKALTKQGTWKPFFFPQVYPT